MSLFDDYLKNRETQQTRIKENISSKRSSFKDDRMWKPTFHEDTGTGYAVVRFLPGKDANENPWVKIFDHYFRNPVSGNVYWEKSLTTIGKDDPVGELNKKLWNFDSDNEGCPMKDKARFMKRRTSYYANVLVIEDPDNPEAEGKVFIWKFGPKVFQKLQTALTPEFNDEDPINPFDMFESASFKVKMKQAQGGWRSYDASSFATDLTPVSKDEDEMREIFDSQHDIQGLIAPTQLKSYEELSKLLVDVAGEEFPQYLGGHVAVPAAAQPAVPSEPVTPQKMKVDDVVPPAPVKSSVATKEDDDEEDLEEFFASLEDN